MARIACKKVGPQHEKSDTWPARHGLTRGDRRQRCKSIGNAALKPWVIQTKLGVFDGLHRLKAIAKDLARPFGIAIHQKGRQVHHVVFRASKPILQAEKIGAYVLGGARNKAKNFGKPTQHAHLPGTTGRTARARAVFGVAWL